jgi:hypothetical protein
LDILHLKALLADDEFQLRRARPDGRYWLRRREIELRLASRRVQLALLEHEHEHAGGPHKGYDPNQPRVPAGNPDGGQWMSTAGTAGPSGTGMAETSVHATAETTGHGTTGTSGVGAADAYWSGEDWDPTDASAAKKRRPRRWLEPPRDNEPYREVWQAIQAFRVKHTKDFFQEMSEEGVVACTEINGEEVCGASSKFNDAYDADDYRRATDLRRDLIRKHPYVMATRNIGFKPNVAVFHAEATTLLRAAEKNGGTLAGETLVVFVEDTPCPSCQKLLPYIVRELGSPTVTFISRTGWKRTVRDGDWID